MIDQNMQKIVEELFQLASPGDVKNALWQAYQQVLQAAPASAQQPERYNYPQTLAALRDEMTDNQHNYHCPYLEWYEPCATCGKPYRYSCVLCGKGHCDHCLFNIHLRELHEENPRMVQGEFGPERAEPDYEYGLACLSCYTEHEKHPPYSWGWASYRFFSWAAPQGAAIEKGWSVPAGDMDAWVRDPDAASVVNIHYQPDFKPKELDAFELKSFLAWLKAWESQLDQVAGAASATLTKYHNKMHANALRADAGIIDWSQYE